MAFETRQADAARELADEIDPLKQKIHAALANPASQQQPAPPNPQQEEAIKTLEQWSDASKESMLSAGTDLVGAKLGQAKNDQSAALDPLDRIYLSVAPVDRLLQKGSRIKSG
ncbi:MAG: hypothetical protein U1D30_25895 [Planctomycetota bacterium]